MDIIDRTSYHQDLFFNTPLFDINMSELMDIEVGANEEVSQDMSESNETTETILPLLECFVCFKPVPKREKGGHS